MKQAHPSIILIVQAASLVEDHGVDSLYARQDEKKASPARLPYAKNPGLSTKTFKTTQGWQKTSVDRAFP